MLVQTVLAAMVRDTMCATHRTEKWFLSKPCHKSVRKRQATRWENGGDLIRDFVQKKENKMAKKKKR